MSLSRFLLVFSSALVLLNTELSAAATHGLDFDGALRAALERAPMLQARAASVQGAAALQVSAAQLPDPKILFGIDGFPINGPNRGSLTRDDFTQQQIGWVQDVPNRAKRAARSDVAQARTEREQALLETERLTVRREAGLAWLARHFAEKRLALFSALTGHHRLLQTTAPSQFAAGKISASEVATIELEGLALADRRDELQREVDQAAATLRRWVGDAAGAETVGDVPVLKVDRPFLLANLERNPEIAAFVPMRALGEAEMREAAAARHGDWSWSVGYGKRGPGFGDLVSAQFTFELPLAVEQRQQPQIHARQKEVERIGAEREEWVLRQTQELDTLLAENAELERKLTRLRQETQPLSDRHIAFALAGYQSGRDKLSTVLEARKQRADVGLRGLELEARQRAVQWRLNSIIPEQAP